MRSSHTIRRIVAGFLFILILTVAVFTALTRFMNRETEHGVSVIAQTYLVAMAQEELNSFDMFADFRYSQTAYIEYGGCFSSGYIDTMGRSSLFPSGKWRKEHQHCIWASDENLCRRNETEYLISARDWSDLQDSAVEVGARDFLLAGDNELNTETATMILSEYENDWAEDPVSRIRNIG